MKKVNLKILLVLSIFIIIYACGKDDEPTPEPVLIPTITDFSPISGPIGAQVTITGTNFGATNVENVVKFGKVTAILSSSSTTSLVTTVPEGAVTSKISVTANKKTAISEIDFTVTVAQITLTMDNTSLELYTLDNETLNVTGANGNTIVWSSDNETVVTVDNQGNVTAIAAGLATITATIGNATATCTVTVSPNVYVAGYEMNNENIDVAILWKNGVAQALTNGDRNARTSSVFVSNTGDVYVVGKEKNDGNKNVATLWKNGDAQALTNGENNAYATSVFINGTDLYVVGYEHINNGSKAMLWHVDDNGVKMAHILDGEASIIYATSVAISDTDDIYIWLSICKQYLCRNTMEERCGFKDFWRWRKYRINFSICER